MAIARLSMKVGKSGSAAPHAAYIAREGRYANRLEKGEKLEATEAGNMPAWAQKTPQAFWQAADANERKNGTTYREMEIALPRELNKRERVELVRDFVRQEIGERHAYQWAIHSPKAADGDRQPHVHLMFSERQRDGIERDPEHYFKRYNGKNPERGGAKKGYGSNAGQTLTKIERVAELKALRGRWERMCNDHLASIGSDARIDMRSYREQGRDIAPEAKQLPSQWRDPAQRGVILEFRQANKDAAEAQRELAPVVPNAGADLIDLQAERQRRDARDAERERRRQAEDAAVKVRAAEMAKEVVRRSQQESAKRQEEWQRESAKRQEERQRESAKTYLVERNELSDQLSAIQKRRDELRAEHEDRKPEPPKGVLALFKRSQHEKDLQAWEDHAAKIGAWKQKQERQLAQRRDTLDSLLEKLEKRQETEKVAGKEDSTSRETQTQEKEPQIQRRGARKSQRGQEDDFGM